MSETAAFSKRSLFDKLGLKTGQRACFLNAPADYLELLAPLPPGLITSEKLADDLDFIQFFTNRRATLTAEFPALKAGLAKNGTLWICWPKGSSKLPKDLNDNQVRNIGLENGLVDVKVIAIDADWSGLKFVYRVKDR